MVGGKSKEHRAKTGERREATAIQKNRTRYFLGS